MKYIDIHSHLGFEDLSAQAGYGVDKDEVINRMVEAEVGTIAIGADLASSIEAVKVATENENIWACIGLHPDALDKEKFNEEDYIELVKNPKVVAVGECGLDYYRLQEKTCPVVNNSDCSTTGVKAKQKEIFTKQIYFALKYDKALMLHIRNSPKKLQGSTLNKTAFEDVLEILNTIKQEQGLTLFRGNVHFFTGKLDMARKFIDLGFTISFVGLITYVEDFNKIIRNVPLESLQAETDAPYVAPVPHRGERNEPSYVIEVYKKIAEIRGEDPEIVRLKLLENARRIFGV